MITPADFHKILFLDIETVPCQEHYNAMESRMKAMWDKKATAWKDRGLNISHPTNEELFYNRAGLYAEFGKILAIGIGCLYIKSDQFHFRVKCLAGTQEKEILTQFIRVINRMELTARLKKQSDDKEPAVVLCAHNGKEFDFPYIARRLLINNMRLPEPLKVQGSKPWEIPHLDTMDLWRFGDYKNYTSLDLLAATFGIASPKTQMDGSQVGVAFYK
jgi:3'-5' exonuclease